MAKYVIDDSTLTSIADAIREKAGTSGMMQPGEMAALIGQIITSDNVHAYNGSFKLSSSGNVAPLSGVDSSDYAFAVLVNSQSVTGSGRTVATLACVEIPGSGIRIARPFAGDADYSVSYWGSTGEIYSAIPFDTGTYNWVYLGFN